MANRLRASTVGPLVPSLIQKVDGTVMPIQGTRADRRFSSRYYVPKCDVQASSEEGPYLSRDGDARKRIRRRNLLADADGARGKREKGNRSRNHGCKSLVAMGGTHHNLRGEHPIQSAIRRYPSGYRPPSLPFFPVSLSRGKL
jgi:hypothetical protein